MWQREVSERASESHPAEANKKSPVLEMLSQALVTIE
jgi:hypothetical protein